LITITVANSEGNLKEAAVIETSHVTKNPQCECITLDRTPVNARPLRDGRPAGAWVSVTKADGTVLAPRPLTIKVSAPPIPVSPPNEPAQSSPPN
jgi:hypothetical protein